MNRGTDEQRDRWTNRETVLEMERWIDRWIERWTEGWKERRTVKQIHCQTGGQMNRGTGGQMNRGTDGQRDRWTNRQTVLEMEYIQIERHKGQILLSDNKKDIQANQQTYKQTDAPLMFKHTNR
jgi:hypothetical protein